MKTILFVTATVKEMKAALGGVCILPALKQGVAVPFDFRGKSGLLLVTGIGIINSAFALGQTLAKYEIELVVLAGVAGTFDPERFPVGSACVVKTEIWPEYGLKKEKDVDPKGLGFSLAEVDNKPIWDRVDLFSGSALKKSVLDRFEKLPEAVSLTVSGVTATADEALRLKTEFGADIENMEGFATAYGCTLSGIPVCQVRTVSNLVGSRDRKDWDLLGALAELGRICSALVK
ncbi:futalosine hydrolase [Maridesulfovibrio ferrireducens]|uniref:Futalosine hydrolase n=1 Tax=Maridesulfovibrio ferrireducens TaxID=246191 RepID=A0A1G9G3U5_9BACT|nr:futalosine hydrolase [Maridesulfovibrio ferrireducens]SDK95316.1 futalosine hydrolase [Maridesulfovibrio ferrireducens]